MSTLKVNTIQNTSGGSSSTPEQILNGRIKAWVEFNGQSDAINESLKVITKLGFDYYGSEGDTLYFIKEIL